jgi:hypothetical protein
MVLVAWQRDWRYVLDGVHCLHLPLMLNQLPCAWPAVKMYARLSEGQVDREGGAAKLASGGGLPAAPMSEEVSCARTHSLGAQVCWRLYWLLSCLLGGCTVPAVSRGA